MEVEQKRCDIVWCENWYALRFDLPWEKNGSLERQAPAVAFRPCGLPFKIMVSVSIVKANVPFECCRKRCLPMKAGSKAGDRRCRI